MCSFNQSIAGILRREVGPVCIAYTLVGLSFGAICTSAGLALWVPVALSLVVFAGSAQFAAVGVVLSGGALGAAIAAGLVINARLVPYSFAVRDALGGSRGARLIAAHLITDVNTALVMRETRPARRRALFRWAGLAVFLTWNLSVAAGAVLGQHTADTHALGLDAALPAILFALVRAQLDDPATRYACITGSVIALAGLAFLPAGVPVLVALAGTGVAVIHRYGTRAKGRAS